MNFSYSIDKSDYDYIYKLINTRNFSSAEKYLNSFNNKNAEYHYLYGILLQKKSWFDEALNHFKIALSLSPNNILYKESLISLMSRYRHYSDNYYNNGYRKRNHGCSCCCCDCCNCCSCCDCGNFSCCDLICLDQCCECMGGDLIECI